MITVRSSSSQLIGALASEALMTEAALSPKPGLVTPMSNGAHSDMDFPMFLASARALKPFFEACASVGEAARTQGSPPVTLLEAVRRLGLQGEEDMFRATGGINTHKGAVFCLGLLSAATGHLLADPLRNQRDGPLGNAACDFVGRICSGLVERELEDFENRRPCTVGEMLYRMHGIRGARGHAQDGYPILKQVVLPRLRQEVPTLPQACLDALLASMAVLEDTCLLARGGHEGLGMAQRGALHVLQAGGARTPSGRQRIRALDERMCEQRLSPGGSADMLAAGLFLVWLEQQCSDRVRVKNVQAAWEETHQVS